MATLPALVTTGEPSLGPEPATEPQGMTDNELVSLLREHEVRSIGYFDNEIASEQAKAINYYYGKMDDLPAQEGCSSVVDHTVAVMVDNGLAAVLKPFVSAEEVVSFAPRGPEDVAQAEQATEYVNYVISCDNPGFTILHDWFKDALLTKLGIVKVWWEDQSRQEPKQEVVDALGLMQARQADTYQGEQENPDGTYSVNHLVTIPDGRVKVQNVPPEEFLITPYARSLEETPYVAHRPNNFTRSMLIEMGVDAEIADTLPAYAPGDTEEQRRLARYRDEDFGQASRDGAGNDRSQDIIAVLDEYVRCDYNGDGIAELRRVVRVGDIVLLNDEVDDCPFATLCPVPMPHKVYGRSTADQSIEGQRIATVLQRQTLDNVYKSNNPRPVINDQAMTIDTLDDIADTAPGAAIRVKGIGAIDWAVVPFSAQYSLQLLEMNARGVEERTGIQRKGQGFNADALKKNSPDTATQAAIDENSRNERAEMIARIFAETGVKRLFKLILGLVVAHQPKERIIRLRNQWVDIDPRGWNPEMDVTISVGLGVGNKADQIMQADAVLQTMAELQQTPYAYLIDAEKVHNALKRKFTATGIKNVDDFLVDPKQAQPPPPQPSPEEAKMQAEMQMKAADQQFRQNEAAQKLQLQQQSDAAKHQLEQMKAQAEADLARARAEQEAQLAQAKAQFEAGLAREKMSFEQQMERERIAMDRELQHARVQSDHEVKMQKNREGGKLDE